MSRPYHSNQEDLAYLGRMIAWKRLQFRTIGDLMHTPAIRHDWCTFVILEAD